MSRLHIAIVAGEPSGDLLGASVLASLREHFDELEIEGIGGPQMQAQGLNSLFPMERLSVMGLVEPLKRLPELLRIRRHLVQRFRDRKPDLFLGIDSPDFNLRIEQQMRRSGILAAHLVSPSVWAWRSGRVRKIRRSVDLMLCLFPFETDVYRRNGVPVRFVGHPMADEIPADLSKVEARRRIGLGEGPLLALLPGSRESEVRLLCPLFLQAARQLLQDQPGLSFVIPASSEQRSEQIQQLLRDYPELPVKLVPGRSREVMSAADTVLLSSGTATLEAALIGRPMVVAYRMGALSWMLLSRLVKTPYAALPNILARRTLVPELIQNRATAAAMVDAMAPLLAGGIQRNNQISAFGELRQSLGQGAASNAATALVELMRPEKVLHG